MFMCIISMYFPLKPEGVISLELVLQAVASHCVLGMELMSLRAASDFNC